MISAKQCVSVSDCVVFVREMGGAVCGVIGRRLFVIRGGIGGGNYVGWRWRVGRFAPIFLFLVCLVGV